MDVSLEIVPRSEEALREGAAVGAAYPAITCINIPDLLRFPLRSWEACGLVDGRGRDLIPHLRARAFDPAAPFPLKALFEKAGIRKALVIAGDPLAGEAASDGSPSINFIKKLKTEMPALELYAAFDPYRTNIRFELDYLAAKEEAGAAGFMSQPFFDLRLLEIYAEYLEGKRVFWGIAPVLNAANRAYWESRNRAIFPRSFRTDLAWNVDFGREVLAFCAAHNFNLYLMPIKVDLSAYLDGLFGGAQDDGRAAAAPA
ncbi:MAG: methylenetetrahydrofolate reductase [Treponema sp.]|jgi:methylenetetrahydrofolate reductase (NADPH)|nr:methylenetetrahydrofolate reductase [Treponema sp.]